MPTPRLSTSSTSDAMKSMEGNDSLDTFIRQAVGKEPYLSFSRTNDSPVQWIQLLHALDQQELPGWPLLTPMKVQMQKCDKCFREFCSPINYRRHIRMHRRSLNIDKESHKNRDLLGAFWNKLSYNEAKEIVSFDDVILEEVPGSSIIKALASFIYKPGFFALSQSYVKAGSLLLDVIQARPSRLPISSQELFSILDDASERTFLCAGTAESMKKYVFDKEAGKVALEMKNLVACTSFLIEQKLVKAWLADKDAEALRCQKLLVEEEEATMRRQAELLERKRQKKLRQKEQKAKEQHEEEPLTKLADNISESTLVVEPSSPTHIVDIHAACDGTSDDVPTVPGPVLNNEPADIEAHGGFSSELVDLCLSQNAEHRKSQKNGSQHLVATRWQVPKSQKVRHNGCHYSSNLNMVKPEPTPKHTSHRDARAAPVNRSKVWTRKSKAENRGECSASKVEENVNQIKQTGCAVMIGSISVTVRNCCEEQANCQSESQDNCNVKHLKEVAQEKLMKDDIIHSSTSTSRSTVKCWMPVSRHESRGQSPIQSKNPDIEQDSVAGIGTDHTIPGDSCSSSFDMENNIVKRSEIMETKGLPFSTHTARVFLAERWKEAVSGDHVTLLLSPESDCQPTSMIKEYTNGDSTDNRLGKTSSSNKRVKAKFRTKSEKNVQIKYIPKQKNNT